VCSVCVLQCVCCSTSIASSDMDGFVAVGLPSEEVQCALQCVLQCVPQCVCAAVFVCAVCVCAVCVCCSVCFAVLRLPLWIWMGSWLLASPLKRCCVCCSVCVLQCQCVCGAVGVCCRVFVAVPLFGYRWVRGCWPPL